MGIQLAGKIPKIKILGLTKTLEQKLKHQTGKM